MSQTLDGTHWLPLLRIPSGNNEIWIAAFEELCDPLLCSAGEDKALHSRRYDDATSAHEALDIAKQDVIRVNSLMKVLYASAIGSAEIYGYIRLVDGEIVSQKIHSNVINITIDTSGSNFGNLENLSPREILEIFQKSSIRMLEEENIYDLLYWYGDALNNWYAIYICCEIIIRMYGRIDRVPNNENFQLTKFTANWHRHYRANKPQQPIGQFEAYREIRRQIIILLIAKT